MYDKHNPQIAAGMKSDPETFARGVLFSALSARQPIISVPDMLRDVDRNGADAIALALPNKFECYDFLQSHATRTWREVLERTTAETVRHLAFTVPGLGIVKAAFVLQLMGHDIACLDTHNMRKLGLKETAFKNNGRANPYSKPQFKRYLKLAFGGGQSRRYWDDWCTDRAMFYERTPEDISALHLAIIN